MNFELSEDQKAIRDMVADFAAKEIAPHAPTWDQEHTFPGTVFVKLGALGLCVR